MRDPSDPTARVRHSRIELPDDDHQRLRRAARSIGLSVAGYIRMSVLERVAEDERRAGVWPSHLPRSLSASDAVPAAKYD